MGEKLREDKNNVLGIQKDVKSDTDKDSSTLTPNYRQET